MSVSGSCEILQVTALLAKPVVATTACNCTSNPALADASLGLTVTLVTAGVSVVNTQAPFKWRSRKYFPCVQPVISF